MSMKNNPIFWMLAWMVLFFLSSCGDEHVEALWIPKTMEMHKGYTLQLTDPFSTKNIKWRSSNPGVLTVSPTGLATAISEGDATIYTSDNENDIAYYIEVHPKRNILFYIATDADANIDDDTPGKIDQIRAGWKPNQGEMLVYVDRRGQEALFLRINNTLSEGYYGLDTLARYGVENSADPAVLSRMIDSLLNYPADSYGLIFFSHASGWLPAGGLNNPRSSETNQQQIKQETPNELGLRSIVIDNGGETRYEMEYDDFAEAIPDHQLDFIILEACLMGDVMSMYALRNKAAYVLVSSAEIVSPGFSYIYKDDIMRLYDTKNSVFSVVSGFAQAFHDFLITRYQENSVFCSSTLSIIKMDEMNMLSLVTKNVLQSVDFDESNLDIQALQRFDRPMAKGMGGKTYSRFFDFAHTVESLIPESQYAAFRAQMEKTVVWKAETKRFLLGNYSNGEPDFSEYDGFFIERHSGLTTYIKQDVYPTLNAVFEGSDWYKAIE